MTHRIYIDADACPVKDEIYRVSERTKTPVILVANSHFRVPNHPLIFRHIVSDGFDAADDWIVEQSDEKSLVVTADIELADRAIKKGAMALRPNGDEFTPANISGQMATRAIMADLRASADGATAGIGGPKPFSKKDRSNFLMTLDRMIVKLRRR